MSKVPTKSQNTKQDVDAFLNQVAAMPSVRKAGKGRLMFAMDATASRDHAWDQAMQLQGEMFQETAALGGLDIQLAFFRGFGEFRVSSWQGDADGMLRLMTSVNCLAGQTQIYKVLKHATNETRKQKVNALVYVGDACEEDIDKLGQVAGELGLLGVPAFMFHEGDDPIARFGFQQIAKLSGGAYHSFDASSAHVLRSLLKAVAVYAAGGAKALNQLASKDGGAVKQLAHQVKR